MAGPYWEANDLDDNYEDVKFRYFIFDIFGIPIPAPSPESGRPLKDLDLKRNWIIELSKKYWGVPHEDPPEGLNQKNLTLNITLSKYEYNVGDILEANITISNLNNMSITSNLTVEIISDNLFTKLPGDVTLNYSEQEIIVPPNTNYSVYVQYKLPYNLSSIDNYYVKAKYATETAKASFAVKALYEINIAIPTTVTLSSPTNFPVSITVSNEWEETINNLTACLDSSYNLNVIDSPCKNIHGLPPHSNTTFSWNVEANNSGIGSLYFKITSENGGSVSFTKHIDVLSPPALDVENMYVEVSEENLGVPFKIGFKVRNIGNLNATNISVNITLPENVVATDKIWHIDKLVGGDNVTLYTNITFTKPDDFVIDIYACAEEGNDTGIIYVHVIPLFSGNLTTVADYGIDTDGDGLYNYLRVNSGVNVTSAGEAVVKGYLYDSNGSKITEAENSTYLDIGEYSIILNFDGLTIFKHKVNGPYIVNLKLEDKDSNLLDEKNYTTSTYNYTDFQHLVALTGYYSDYGKDIDNDGIFDYLIIDVGVFMVKPGHCFIKARLMDASGEEIVWAENTTWLETGEQIIQLNFNGTVIYEHGVNGPYYLRDVYVYHTGDPTQSDYVYEAHTTKAYSYLEFGENLPPMANANGPYQGTEGQPIQFDGSASYDPEGMPLTYYWDFGDGKTGSGVNPTHVYAQEGNYTVSLVVNDGIQNSTPSVTYALINDTEPQADFKADPTSGFSPLTVQFTDLSNSYDGIVVWEWDFDGDGITDVSGGIESMAQNPTWTYTEAGTYTVSLTVYEADGDSDTETKTDYISVTSAIDTIPPVIQSVTLDSYINIPNSTFHLTVEVSDNVGVALVTADGIPLVE
ncbi:MAG TPA: PKD domain-containing protein, partial [Archaeoglobaceae archaeon]|nr:PKD domain-containing protein [Archaeoglobaceae archaeon]